MTREEFERTVKGMQNEGVPLTMANLLVRTELPRATIQDWLDDMQRDVRPAAAKVKSTPSARNRAAATGDGGGDGLLDRARALKNELLGEVVKSKLGIDDDDDAESRGKPHRGVKVGGILGVALPPAGLLYSAPWQVGAVGSAGYVVAAAAAWLIPFIGIPYILIPVHLVGGLLGAGYAWRFNMRGKRTHLLPGGGKSE